MDITCVDLYGITYAPESENVLKVDTRNGKLLRVPSWRKDELVVVNKLFPSLQYNLLSDNVDGGDGLTVYPSFTRHFTNGF